MLADPTTAEHSREPVIWFLGSRKYFLKELTNINREQKKIQIGAASKPNRRSTAGSVQFRAVVIA